MRTGIRKSFPERRPPVNPLLVRILGTLLAFLLLVEGGLSQSANTGALTGTATDPSGAVAGYAWSTLKASK